MPKKLNTGINANRALNAKLKPITHLPFLAEIHHFRLLLLGLEQQDQKRILNQWITKDKNNSLFNQLIPYKRAKLRFNELKEISQNMMLKLQSYMMDISDEIIIEKMNESIISSGALNDYTICLLVLKSYKKESFEVCNAYFIDDKSALALSTKKWDEMITYAKSIRPYNDRFLEFSYSFYVKSALLSACFLYGAVVPTYKFFHAWHSESEPEWQDFQSSAKRAPKWFFLALFHLLNTAKNYFTNEKPLGLKIGNEASFRKMTLDSLLSYIHDHNHNESQPYGELLSLLSPSYANDASIIDKKVACEDDLSLVGDRAPLLYRDIKHENNDYFQLKDHDYVRFNTHDLTRLHPNKKSIFCKKDIQELYDTVLLKRECQKVTKKEESSPNSPFVGMDVKLKSTACLAFKIRLPTKLEYSLGITERVYTPKAIVHNGRRS